MTSKKITPEVIKTLAAETDDFGHEMRVGGILRSIPKIGPVEHGGTYFDPNKKIARQFDYRFRLETGNRAIMCAVECKNLSKRPLVVCGASRTHEESYHDVIEVVPPGPLENGRGYSDVFWSRTRRFHGQDSLYPTGAFVGKSTFRVGVKSPGQPKEEFVTEPDTDVYDGWAQALSSCHDLCQVAGTGAGLRKGHLCSYLVLPLLVVPDSSVWKIQYTEDGHQTGDPVLVDECDLFVGRTIPVLEGHIGHSHNIQISHLRILTLNGLKSFCELLGTGGIPQRQDGGRDVSLWGRSFPHVSPLIV